MTWVQSHPQANQLISQSVNQFQQNNLYIQNTLQQDHFFADAIAGNDGHHQFMQMPAQIADPALSFATGAVEYCKTVGGVAAPFFRNAGGVYSGMVAIQAGVFPLPIAISNTYNFFGMPAMTGTILVMNPVNLGETILSPFYWDGAALTVPAASGQLSADGPTGQLRFVGVNGTLLTVATNGVAFNVNIRIYGVFPL